MANCYSSSEQEETIESSSSDDEIGVKGAYGNEQEYTTGELATLHYDESGDIELNWKIKSNSQVGWEICIGAPVRNVY